MLETANDLRGLSLRFKTNKAYVQDVVSAHMKEIPKRFWSYIINSTWQKATSVAASWLNYGFSIEVKILFLCVITVC